MGKKITPVDGIFAPSNPLFPLKDAVSEFPFDYKKYLLLATQHVQSPHMVQRIADVPGMTEVRESVGS